MDLYRVAIGIPGPYPPKKPDLYNRVKLAPDGCDSVTTDPSAALKHNLNGRNVQFCVYENAQVRLHCTTHFVFTWLVNRPTQNIASPTGGGGIIISDNNF